MRSVFTAKLFLPAAFLLLTAPPAANAQEKLGNGLHLGVDVLNSLWAMGLVVEPNVKAVFNEKWVLSATYGYANIRRDSVYYNLAYQTEGHYVKPGIEYLFPNGHFSLGVHYLYGTAQERGHVIYRGPYFGDKRLDVNREIKTTGVELNMHVYIPVARRLNLHIMARTGVVNNSVKSGNFPEMPVYYAPGAGYVLDNKPPGQTGTFGINLGLMYQLTGNTKVKPENEPQPD